MIQIVPNKPGSEQIDWALRQPLILEGQTSDRGGQNVAGLNCIMTPMPRRSAVNAAPFWLYPRLLSWVDSWIEGRG